MDNKIHMQISEEIVNSNLQKIDEIEASIPGLISLTPDEKSGAFKMGEKSLSFVRKTLEFMHASPEFVPGFVDVAEAQLDFDAAAKLLTLGRKMQVLSDKISDSATRAGIETMSAAMAYYNNVRLAARQGVPGARTVYDELSTRFPSGGRSPKKNQTPE